MINEQAGISADDTLKSMTDSKFKAVVDEIAAGMARLRLAFWGEDKIIALDEPFNDA